MGNYITKVDILSQIDNSILIQLTDDESVDVIDDTKITSAIENAESEIDSYLLSKYTVPLTPVPKIIKKYAVDIAIKNLYSRRQGAPEDRLENYKNAIRFLENAAKGVVTLGVSTPAPEAGVEINYTKQDRVFTRDTLKNY